ncbi:MAG: sigma-70 family RNA polymerase sigma factor [Myxococcota bacterium]
MSTSDEHAHLNSQVPTTARGDLVERDLFRAWCRGDQRQGTILLRRLRARLLDYFRHCPVDLAEDLTHDTLLAFVEGRSALRDARALRAFVYRIARRTLIRTLYRKQRLVLCWSEDGVVHERIDGIDLTRIDIRTLLNAHPTRSTTTVVEHYLGGWSTPEIARARQVEVRAVRNQLRNGLAKLRRSVATSAATGARS